MQRPSGRRDQVIVASAAAVAVVISGCGEGNSGDQGQSGTEAAARTYEVGLIGSPAQAGEPVDGGEITFGAFAEAAVLDPAQTIAAASTGGIEMAAVYDVLMRWDAETDEVVPQLAESLESSEDHRRWTLTLRPDVAFSDGTPLDAEAVAWSIERYVAEQGEEAALWSTNVTGVETPDPRTLVFSLNTEWPSFDFLLTTGPGMIVGRSSDAAEEFTPVGAGAFTLADYRPKEETVLAAREDYWGGAPRLDRIRVIYIPDPTALYDSFTGGSVDLGVSRDPQVVSEAVDADTTGYLNPVSLGNVALINSNADRPGADPRVRQAMQLALDVDGIDQRAFRGSGLASSAIFPPFSQWNTDVAPLGHDPERARALLAEAKADGFDGTIGYLTYATPSRRAIALSVKGLLESVGFAVEIEELSADTTQAQLEVMRLLQEEWNAEVPALVYGATPELVMWSNTVHGVPGTANSTVLLDEAWVSP